MGLRARRKKEEEKKNVVPSSPILFLSDRHTCRANGSYDHEHAPVTQQYDRPRFFVPFLIIRARGCAPPTREAGRCGARLVKPAVFLPGKRSVKKCRIPREKSTSLFREHGYFFERMDRAQLLFGWEGSCLLSLLEIKVLWERMGRGRKAWINTVYWKFTRQPCVSSLISME